MPVDDRQALALAVPMTDPADEVQQRTERELQRADRRLGRLQWISGMAVTRAQSIPVPVWHLSLTLVHDTTGRLLRPRQMLTYAREQLRTVGDPEREWWLITPTRLCHLYRAVSPTERAMLPPSFPAAGYHPHYPAATVGARVRYRPPPGGTRVQ